MPTGVPSLRCRVGGGTIPCKPLNRETTQLWSNSMRRPRGGGSSVTTPVLQLWCHSSVGRDSSAAGKPSSVKTESGLHSGRGEAGLCEEISLPQCLTGPCSWEWGFLTVWLEQLIDQRHKWGDSLCSPNWPEWSLAHCLIHQPRSSSIRLNSDSRSTMLEAGSSVQLLPEAQRIWEALFSNDYWSVFTNLNPICHKESCLTGTFILVVNRSSHASVSFTSLYFYYIFL